jgi:protein SCO1/2
VAVFAVVGWWTHGFRAFTTDSAALVAAGPLPRPAPPLAFTATTGGRDSLAAYQGRYVLLTFMYLHCPDVCHLVTARLHGAIATLQGNLVPGRLVFLSVSLDPARDDPAAIAGHWSAMGAGPGWVAGALATDAGRLPEPALRRLGVWLTHGPGGRINHSASSFLIDPAGNVVAVFRPEVTADSLVTALRAVVR